MATSERIEKSVEDLEREITCAICQCHYSEPKVLPCCHYYCKECIRRLALRADTRPFTCPECRTDTTLPKGSVDNLPTAFFVNRIKEVHSRLARAHGKMEALCEMCSGPMAEAFCRQCAMFICTECVTQHHRMKVFATHKVTSLGELKTGKSKEIVAPKPPLQVCETHDQPMNIYCFDCSCLICRDCTIKTHNTHNHEFLKVAAPEMKKTLVEKLEPLKISLTDLSCAVKEVRAANSSIKVHGYYMLSKIDCFFSELVKNLTAQKQELANVTATLVSEKMEHFSSQEKQLSTAAAVIESVIEYTERCIEHLADDEVMCTHTEIRSQIDREIEKHAKSMKPVLDKTIEVNLKQPKVRTVTSGLGKPFDVAVNPVGEILITERENLILMNKNGERFKCVPASSIGIDLLRGVAVDDITGNIFVTGSKKIIKLNANMEPVKEKSIDSDSMGIAVVKDRIFVCANLCLVYSKDLKFLKRFNPGDSGEERKTGYFHSVCSDQDGNLYFSNCGNSSVSSYNYNGKFLRTFDQFMPTMPYYTASRFTPCGICVSGAHVYVANQKTHSITIFTTEGKYVSSLGRKGCSNGTFDYPQGICADKDGYLYICDKERVQVVATRLILKSTLPHFLYVYPHCHY